MKGLVIFALFFAVNSAFLRQLEGEITISAATLTDTCVEKGDSKTLNLALTAGAEVGTDGTFTALLSGEGEAKIEPTCTKGTATTFTCTNDLTSATVGTYTFESLTETNSDETAPVSTFVLGDEVSAVFIYAEPVTLAETQETAQTVDLKDEKKKSFKIALDTTTAATGAPAVFAGEATTPLSACTLSEDAATVTCNPTDKEMKDGEKYKIYYNNGCTRTETGIEVTFENGSVFMTVSKIALIAFALLF